ncbi:MAG: hypothetical protein H6825_11920 [Planctomycetes bacterium]|nr:hypothetical protein [Planctomycetota bacterium]
MSQPVSLVVHRRTPATFEDALRSVLHDAPYLGVALLVHGLLLTALFFMRVEPPALDMTRPPIVATPEPEALVPLEPPPPPLEPETPPEDFPEPTLSEEPQPDLPPTDVPYDAPIAPTFSSDPAQLASAVLGIGGGPTGIFSGTPGGGGGGTHATPPFVKAIEDGLGWLAAHQDPDGHWSASAFDDQCGRQGDDVVCDGRGSPAFDVGVTGLALLAFQGAGVNESRGRWSDTLKRGLRYLVDVQRGDGLFPPEWSGQGTYDQAIATLVLCEAYGHGHRRAIGDAARRSVDALLRLRTPGSGWRYMPGSPEMADPGRAADTSVTGWAMLALLSARKAGLLDDDRALDDALLFLDLVTDRETGRSGYTHAGEGVARPEGGEEIWPAQETEALTAVSVLCRIFGDPDLRDEGRRASVEKGVQLIAAIPPVWDDAQPGRRDFYYWYYGTYALYQVGGSAWKRWEKALGEAVLPSQQKTGERRGSWDPQADPWGRQGGRVYSTALLTLTLEVYFRYEGVLSLSLGPR